MVALGRVRHDKMKDTQVLVSTLQRPHGATSSRIMSFSSSGKEAHLNTAVVAATKKRYETYKQATQLYFDVQRAKGEVYHVLFQRDGALGFSLHLVRDGEDGRTIYATLDAGSFFGEGALFSNVRRAASIRCACFSECLALSRADLQHRLRAFGFPQRRLLDEFTTIRRRNADVNAAISRNLKEAERAGSRLRRVLGDVPGRVVLAWAGKG